mgnify:CR=1 FL=1
MQIYVHISGKNYGPYSIDQLREYVSKGSFKSDSQACYDGKNWVRSGNKTRAAQYEGEVTELIDVDGEVKKLY